MDLIDRANQSTGHVTHKGKLSEHLNLYNANQTEVVSRINNKLIICAWWYHIETLAQGKEESYAMYAFMRILRQGCHYVHGNVQHFGALL